jgi:DNA polymerase V
MVVILMAKIIAELNGIACIDLEAWPRPSKTSTARSFGIPVTSIDSLMEAVTLYVCRAVEKTRAQHSHAHSISVFIHTSPFAYRPYYGNCPTVALPSPISARILLKTASGY